MMHPLPAKILFQPLSHVKGEGVGVGVTHRGSATLGAGRELVAPCVELSFGDMLPDAEVIFFDGECGLCHRAVRFILRHDREERFRFAPLQGETFLRQVPEVIRSRLPDTLVVAPSDGRYLLRSDGVLYVLENLGSSWKVLGRLVGWLPRSFRDSLYDAVAAWRARLFSGPSQHCPVVQPELRQRFDP